MSHESFHPESQEEEEKQKIVIVETSNLVKDKARDVGEARLSESERGVRGIITRIWKHNLFHEYYRQKEVRKAKNEILESGDLYIHEEDAEGAHDATMKTIVNQFASDYDEAIHAEAGEKKEFLGNTEKEEEIKDRVKNLILDFSLRNLSDENVLQSFNEEKNRILSLVTGVKRDVVDGGDLYADNLLEITKGIQNNLTHGKGIRDVDFDFDYVVGKAKGGVRTEAQFNTVDEILDKVQSTRLGRFANEATISGAVSIAHALSAGIVKRVANSKFFAWGSFGATAALGAGIAGLREKKRLEEERRQHAREMAMGKTFPLENSNRRKLMEEFRYETRESDDLKAALERSVYYVDKDGNREMRELNEEELRSALSSLSEIEARIKLSDRENIDLISYSDVTKIEQERLSLDILRAQVKIDLRQLISSGNPELKNSIPEDKSLDEYIDSLAETRVETLVKGDEGMEKRDELFASMRRKQVAKAVVKGLVTGVTIGAGVQEVASLFTDQEGVVEGIKGGDISRVDEEGALHMTSLEYLRRYFTDTLPKADIHSATEIQIGTRGLIKVPEGVSVIDNPDGTFNLVRGDDIIGKNIAMDESGSLGYESVKALREHGVFLNSTPGSIVDEKEMVVGAADYVEAHEDEMTKIHRELWYDNNTPKPVFDKNELKLWWGGEKGTGIDKDGNYVYNIKQMAKNGSYHGRFSADAKELAREGKLKMLFSLSRDTQQQVFEVPIDANFNAVIDPNSEVGKLLFANEDGKAKLLAKFAEVAEVTGTKDGVEQVKVLATDVGRGVDTVTDLVRTSKDVPITIFDFPGDYRVDPPPFIPVFGRPGEPFRKKDDLVPAVAGGYYYSYGSRFSPEEKRALSENFSEKLKEGPDVELDHNEEIKKYLEKQNADYMEELEGIVRDSEPMDPDCKVAICIPVAGHQEGDNIFRTLENYTNQKADNKSFELVLFVNRPEKDAEGNEVEPDKTISEILRFKKEYPDIRVRVTEKVLPIEKAKIGYIRKVNSDITLMRHHERGEEADDLIMVSNDADNKGIAPEYVQNLIDKFEENKNVDSYLGQLDWDPESYVRNPLVHIGTRLFQYIASQSRRTGQNIESSGANFAYRSSIYAAVGGYSTRSTLGEDVEFGKKIKVARENSKNHKAVGFAGARVSRLYTSSRRAEKALRDGLSPIEQWDWGFSAFDDEVRKVKWEEFGNGIDFENKEQTERFLFQLENVINRTMNTLRRWELTLDAADPSLGRALGWLGIKYRIAGDNSIKITDAEGLIRGLKEYQVEGLKIMENKTGIKNTRRRKIAKKK